MKKMLYLFFFLLLSPVVFGEGLSISSFGTDQHTYLGLSVDFNVEVVNDYNVDKNINLKLYDFSSKVVDVNDVVPGESSILTSISYVIEGIVGPHDLNLLLFSDGNLVDSKVLRIDVEKYSAGIVVDSMKLPDEILVNEEMGITVLFRNMGESAEKQLVKIFHGNTDTSNLLFLQYIDFPSNTEKSIYFTFTPRITGTDVIIVEVEGKVIREELFVVSSGGELPGAAYTVSLYLQKGSESCVLVLNNGDKFFFKNITQDGNMFKVNFTLTDKFGTPILDTYGEEGDEFIEKARTVRFITVGEFAANVIMAYSYPVSVSYSTCTTSLSELVDKLDKCEATLRAQSTDISECEIKRRTADNSAAEYQNQLVICQTAVSERDQSIGQLTSQINESKERCNEDIEVALSMKEETIDSLKNENETYRLTTLPSLKEEIYSWTLVASLLSIFFTISVLLNGYMLYLRGGRLK